ncbi:class I SAM-dependent methyltransferase [Ochrobactrum sp. SFR4]|uniref:class I SAM-dependent methyltransferase n=1 Tax=Ochrobactrum sp. SFR4 TaxID=2717368 RepID=UPI001C8CD594|nr:class I SAM-dependent methyltransferase [Ochrobactrum sp. SFR4]MBX8826109.1 class I SAM-dependent methyltransferase [Ochrobactrum sp. SFR4]
MAETTIPAADKLKQRLIRLITNGGPISVADYMAFCLADHDGGYYMTREPFGAKGDFITAPEVSQMFGELIGIWVVSHWEALGKPENCTICEIGGGRGTLMSDLLRAAGKLAPGMLRTTHIAMVETSDRLTGVQKKKLEGAAPHMAWYKSFGEIPQNTLILVANELFDALPDHQYVKHEGRFVERMVATRNEAAPELCFTTGTGGIDPTLLPQGHETAPEGTIFEASPARSALMQQISEHIRKHKGAALLIDYGSHEAGFGDTLQALYQHAYQDVFIAPGQADITTHVDFAALAQIASGLGCTIKAEEQGGFLLRMGLLSRAGQLGAGKSASVQEQIRDDVERLAAPNQMGSLFKVLSVTYPDLKTI